MKQNKRKDGGEQKGGEDREHKTIVNQSRRRERERGKANRETKKKERKGTEGETGTERENTYFKSKKESKYLH